MTDITVPAGTCELIVQYGVEGDELKGRTAEESFMLGAEWGRVYELLSSGVAFTMRGVSYKNQHRITALATYLGRSVRILPMDPEWKTLEVQAH
ncbi:MAG: hypothetical protein V3W06_04355 [Acidimicrobiia bacterium]